MFAGIGAQTLDEIANALLLESWPKGCQIPAATGDADRFRIVVRGRVKVTRTNARNGREITLWLLGPGDGFDIVSLLDGAPHAVSMWTLDEVETLSAPVSVVRAWLERFPLLRLALHRYVAQKLRELTDLASDLALHDTLTRLAHLLLRHFDTQQRRPTPALNLIRDLPQEELAALIGSVRVVVSRVLGELKREAIIEVHNGLVRIADLKRLLARAEAQVIRASGRSHRARATRGK